MSQMCRGYLADDSSIRNLSVAMHAYGDVYATAQRDDTTMHTLQTQYALGTLNMFEGLFAYYRDNFASRDALLGTLHENKLDYTAQVLDTMFKSADLLRHIGDVGYDQAMATQAPTAEERSPPKKLFRDSRDEVVLNAHNGILAKSYDRKHRDASVSEAAVMAAPLVMDLVL